MNNLKTPLKPIVFALGCTSIALGVLGIFLPVLPTTPFLLLASWCFLKSSDKAHHWLINHKWLGPSIQSWQRSGAIAPKAKFAACILILISGYFIYSNLNLLSYRIFLLPILGLALLFIVTRPNN